MTKFKRIISSLLCAATVLSIFAVIPASASAKGITLPRVTYHLTNAKSGDYLSLYQNKDAEEQSIKIEDFAFDVDSDKYDREARQVFKFEKNSAGNYNIQPAMSSTRNIAPSGVPVANGNKIYLYSPDAKKQQDWNVYNNGDGLYVIRNAANTNLVLAQKDSNAVVATFKEGDKSQLWKLTEFSMRKVGDDEKIKSYGIDVSEHQGEINWEAVKEYGIDFAIIRLGYSEGENPGTRANGVKEGTDYTFEENYKAARAAGLKVGSYIYSYATTVEQAKLDAKQALRALEGKTFEYPIYFDIEDDSQYNLSTALRTEMCITFMSMLIAKGYKSGVYASESWFNTRLDHAKIAEVGSTWIAKWPASDQADEDHSDYHLWQFRSDGNIGGIHGNVDVNVDYGEIENFIYNGKPITPKFNVYSNEGTLLKEGVDYTAAYKNNVNAGTATVTYTGIGAYVGKLNFQRTFVIAPRSLSDVTFAKLPERTYNGKAIIPSLTATYNGLKLKKNTDYTVKGKNNVNAGEGTITVTGKGNFVGTRDIDFTIKKKSVKYATVTGVKNMAYTGKKRTLSGLKVKTSTSTLKKGKDYTVTYKNNKEFGTATVTIKGIGDNCRGTYKTTFKIVPKAPDGIKVSKRTKTSMKITWGHSDHATRYQLYRATSENGTYKRIYSTPDRWKYTYTDKGLKEGKHYFYKVRSYIKVDGKKYYSSWTKVSANTKISDTTFSLSGNYDNKSVTVKMKKDTSVTGYIVYMYKKKSGKYEKEWSGTSTKFVKKKLDYNKNYNFKIRTYKDTKYGRIYGTQSQKKSIKMLMPVKPNTPKASNKTTSSVKIKWSGVDNADMYQIYRATSIDGKYKRIHSSKTAGSYIDDTLKEGRYYYYKVRAYRKVNGKKQYGEFSDVVTVKSKLSGTDFKLSGSSKNKTVTVKIDENENATGYLVYMYKKKSDSYEKVWKGTELKYVHEGLESGKTYHFKVRTYKKTKQGTIYGPQSSKKSYTMK